MFKKAVFLLYVIAVLFFTTICTVNAEDKKDNTKGMKKTPPKKKLTMEEFKSRSDARSKGKKMETKARQLADQKAGKTLTDEEWHIEKLEQMKRRLVGGGVACVADDDVANELGPA